MSCRDRGVRREVRNSTLVQIIPSRRMPSRLISVTPMCESGNPFPFRLELNIPQTTILRATYAGSVHFLNICFNSDSHH